MKHILVAEDNENNQLLVDDIFRKQREHYVLHFVADGAAAIQFVTEQTPDLILLDMQLPEVSGWSVATQLKSDDVTKHIPIIAVTAHAMKGDRERALEAGCDDFLTKPIEKQTLLQKVQHWTQ